MQHVIGKPVLLIRPPARMCDAQSEWESRSVSSGEINRRWTEGSFLIHAKGQYYMMYSANYFAGANYAVGYATAKSPLGSYEKSQTNPIIEKIRIEAGPCQVQDTTAFLKTARGNSDVSIMDEQQKPEINGWYLSVILILAKTISYVFLQIDLRG
ncbi:family 43 glycosylhydrolase [Sphingobacterium sp. E70]|uniref:family 43 glycosylhydrolase n=1 Tax=Sphingobacterium sp. E70 TaxID=2853439 RepID=UPI00211BF428|nr:family 43 glycosylhydrolase [Sphingobacterium sp. E70]